MFINNNVIGLDNYKVYSCRVKINPDRLSGIPLGVGLIFGTRELSSFISKLSIESEFEIDESRYENTLKSVAKDNICTVRKNNTITNFILGRLNELAAIDNRVESEWDLKEEDVTEELKDLYGLRKSSGPMYYVHRGRYFMTLFYNLFALNKTDKLFISVIDNNGPTYQVRFRIKKKLNVYIYISYLKL